MSKNLNGIIKLTGGTQDEILIRTGQIGAILSFVSVLGLSITGLSVEPQAEYAPWAILLFSIFFMWYGTKLKKMANQIEQRKRDRPKVEPTRGNEKFLIWFKTLKLPITDVDLARAKNSYDGKRTNPELNAAINSLRAAFWVDNGSITKYGNAFDLRDKTIMVKK